MKARTEKVPDELEGEVLRLRGELACYPPPPVAVKVNGPFCRIPSKSRNWLRGYWDDSRVKSFALTSIAISRPANT
jgi:hypothetical protein